MNQIETNSPLVLVEKLTKRFGKFVALKGISFSIRAGEAIALWGPNGAGKTTILRSILGLYDFEGKLEVTGLDPRRKPLEVRRRIGFVPQEFVLYEDYTIFETLQFFQRLRESPPERIKTVLEQMQLESQADTPVKALSGGIKQRLALSIALLSDPPLLLLDEPTSNLDMASRKSFLGLLQSLKESGKTLFLTSHRFEEVLSIADRMIVLQQGTIRTIGHPEGIPEQLGWRIRLQLYPALEQLDKAQELLEAHPYQVIRNGESLILQLAPSQKQEPLRLLWEAGIEVKDFFLEKESEE